MNLVEHSIVNILSEKKVLNMENGNEYYHVIAVVDSYGGKEQINRLFTVDQWEQAKEKGYFWA